MKRRHHVDCVRCCVARPDQEALCFAAAIPREGRDCPARLYELDTSEGRLGRFATVGTAGSRSARLRAASWGVAHAHGHGQLCLCSPRLSNLGDHGSPFHWAGPLCAYPCSSRSGGHVGWKDRSSRRMGYSKSAATKRSGHGPLRWDMGINGSNPPARPFRSFNGDPLSCCGSRARLGYTFDKNCGHGALTVANCRSVHCLPLDAVVSESFTG